MILHYSTPNTKTVAMRDKNWRLQNVHKRHVVKAIVEKQYFLVHRTDARIVPRYEDQISL